MKKLIILAAASVTALTAMTSCGLGGAKLTSETDTLAYAVAIDFANQAFNFDSTLNPNILAAAIKDVYAKKSEMTQTQAIAFIQEYMTVGMARKNAAAGKEFIEKAVKKGAQTLESGLAYKIEKPGADTKIALGDTIFAKYTLTLPNAQVIDQSGDEARDFVLDEGHIIKAWLEGLPLIGEGGQITLFVPGELAYGENGNPMGGIGPNQAMKFDIEVVKVVPGAQVKDPTVEK